MTPIERLGVGDLTELASDVGPVPMNVGGVLVLDPPVDTDAAARLLEQRILTVPRLRQKLVDVPWWCGRPIWVDDPTFDVGSHIAHVACPAPGDRAALLEVAVAAVTRPLPRSRPLWRAVLVTRLPEGRAALVLALHHVLADGIGGLAVLAALVDPPAMGAALGSAAPPRPADPPTTATPPGTPARTHLPPPEPAPFPRPAPTRRELVRDALADRSVAVRQLPQGLGALWAVRTELGSRGRVRTAPSSSLNAPTGPRRALASARVPLDVLRGVAHAHDATVNDVLLAVVAGALRALLASRGESLPGLVISVPISARSSTTTADLGNKGGVMPVRVPLTGSAPARLAEIAALTRGQKTGSRGASASLVGPAFRLLAALRLFRPFVDRQRLVNSFVTNIRGPGEPLTFGGARVSEIIPVTITAGNVTVAFAALSYAGSMTITVISDPERVPDVAVLTAALAAELSALDGVSESSRRTASSPP